MNKTYWLTHWVIPALMGAVGIGLFRFIEWLFLRPILELQHVHKPEGQRLIGAYDKVVAEHEVMSGPTLKQVVRVECREAYIRMKADNTGRRSANRCRGFLVNIEFEPANGGERRQVYHDSLPLIWSYDVERSMPYVDIPQDASFNLDIFRTEKRENQFFLCVNPEPLDVEFGDQS